MRLQKTKIQGKDVTCLGRLFQVQAAATGKAGLPTFSNSDETDVCYPSDEPIDTRANGTSNNLPTTNHKVTVTNQ